MSVVKKKTLLRRSIIYFICSTFTPTTLGFAICVQLFFFFWKMSFVQFLMTLEAKGNYFDEIQRF